MNLLKDGMYDEGESHAGFLEALNAFRGKKTEKEETPKQKTVKFSEVEKAWEHQKDQSKKGSFFANLDTKNTDFDLGSIPTWQEGGTQPDKKISAKESCWQCFKLYSLTYENSEFKEGSKVSLNHFSYFLGFLHKSVFREI